MSVFANPDPHRDDTPPEVQSLELTTEWDQLCARGLRPWSGKWLTCEDSCTGNHEYSRPCTELGFTLKE